MPFYLCSDFDGNLTSAAVQAVTATVGIAIAVGLPWFQAVKQARDEERRRNEANEVLAYNVLGLVVEITIFVDVMNQTVDNVVGGSKDQIEARDTSRKMHLQDLLSRLAQAQAREVDSDRNRMIGRGRMVLLEAESLSRDDTFVLGLGFSTEASEKLDGLSRNAEEIRQLALTNYEASTAYRKVEAME